jgi:hypothetical protein
MHNSRFVGETLGKCEIVVVWSNCEEISYRRCKIMNEWLKIKLGANHLEIKKKKKHRNLIDVCVIMCN